MNLVQISLSDKLFLLSMLVYGGFAAKIQKTAEVVEVR
jgi:hypothetical protein